MKDFKNTDCWVWIACAEREDETSEPFGFAALQNQVHGENAREGTTRLRALGFA